MGIVLVALALLIGSFTSLPLRVRAADTFTVNTPDDPADNGTASNCAAGSVNPCALRDAVAAANATTDATIIVPAGTYTLTHLATGAMYSALVVTPSVTITGADAATTIIQATADPVGAPAAYRVLNVTGTRTDISGVTIRNGTVANGGAGIAGSNANGTLTLTNTVVSGNTTTTAAMTAYSGGGISTVGTVTLINSTVSGNTASGNGGGVVAAGIVTLTSSTVSGNTANGSGAGNGGGGVYSSKGVAATDSTVENNTATFGNGGGIYSGNVVQQDPTRANSLVYSGSLTLTRATIRNNRTPASGGQGGGVFTITGPGTATTITTSTITGNSTAYSNAGVYNYHGTITVTDSTLSGNRAFQNGGGLAHNDLSAPCTITNSVIADNDADYAGGVFTIGPTRISGVLFSNNRVTSRAGGALYVRVGPTTVVSSTFVGNTTNFDGGAIYLHIRNMASVSVANSTFSANVAQGKGGAISNTHGTESGMLRVVDSTFRGNRAASGGAIHVDVGATPTLIGTILAGSTLAASPTAAPDLAGDFTGTNNLIGDRGTSTGLTDGTNGNLVGPRNDSPLNPGLAPLADNGGATLPNGSHPATFALLPASLAIDAGICGPTYTDALTGMTATVATDQRGMSCPRPVGGNCDIGAFEYTPVVPAVTGSYRVGTSGQPLRIAGTGLQRGSLIRVDGVTLPTSAVNAIADDGTSIIVTLPAHAAGLVTLTVINPGDAPSSATNNLTYETPAAQPTPAARATPMGNPAGVPPVRATAPLPAASTPLPLPLPLRR